MDRGNFWGGLIAGLREEQHISQRTLSARAKVNRSTLRRIEAGETAGDMEIMERLLNYLGYDLEAMAQMNREERLRRAAEDECNPERRSQIAASRIFEMAL